MILKLGPRDYSVLAWNLDEDGEPIYRVVTEKIEAASTAAMLARKLRGILNSAASGRRDVNISA